MLVAGIVAAIIVAPLVAIAVSAVGLRYPFPRIFDRTVMATLLIAMLFAARDLNLVPLLRRGFKHPLAISIARAIRGFVVAMLAIAILFGLALAVGGGGVGDHEAAAALIPKYFLSAIAIAFIEEAFFRAFLLGGMRNDFGNRIALIASAAIYAVAHLVRSPARFYVTGYEPAAGLITLAHSIDQFTDPADRDSHADRPVPLGHRSRRSIYPHGQCVFLDRPALRLRAGRKDVAENNPEPRRNPMVDSRRRRDPADSRPHRMGDRGIDLRRTSPNHRRAKDVR